jgi:glutamyl-tRNA reductase
MYVIGISHKNAPVSVRELFSLSTEEQEEFLTKVKDNEHIHECVLLFTCNRSEVYFSGDHRALQEMQRYFAEFKNLQPGLLLKYFLVYQGEKAMRHLFCVTCGMDSMVLGEDEILGQVKTAYTRALNLGTTKYLLNTLFHSAIACAKKIKTETRLSKTPVSIGTLAANEVFRFSGEAKTVLIIGLTGKLGSILMKNIYDKPKVNIIGTSRSHHTIENIGRDYNKVSMINYELRYQYIDQADIVISATTSPHYTITCHDLEKYILTEKERLFLDLSVPLDIDKEIMKLNGVTLHDIDYFEQVSANNTLIKEQETDQALSILEECLDEAKKQLTFHEFIEVLPLISRKIEKLSFESVLYEIKEKSNSNELSAVLGALRKLI